MGITYRRRLLKTAVRTKLSLPSLSPLTPPLGLPFDKMIYALKFRDDICSGSGVIALTDKQADRQAKSQTNTTENNTTLATLRCTGGKYTTITVSIMGDVRPL